MQLAFQQFKPNIRSGQKNIVAHGDQVGGFLGGQNPGHLRDREHIALFHRAGADLFHRSGQHMHRRGGAGDAERRLLHADVHHACAAFFIKMCQLHAQPPIWFMVRGVCEASCALRLCRRGFAAIPEAMACRSASPCSPRSGISSRECRQGFSFPSAVMRSLLHCGQNEQLIGSMRPTLPIAPGRR